MSQYAPKISFKKGSHKSNNVHVKIVILCSDADAYRPFLNHLEGAEFHSDPRRAPLDADILLAEPDLASVYLAEGGKPRWIQSSWAGVTPILSHAKARRITLTGVKDLFGPAIAEYVFAYVLDDVRDLIHSQVAQREHQWRPHTPASLSGRHMVVVGTGSIGGVIARCAKAFSMRTTGISRSGKSTEAFDEVYAVSEIQMATQDADYLVLTLPDTCLLYTSDAADE